jgi:hypothetical protein
MLSSFICTACCPARIRRSVTITQIAKLTGITQYKPMTYMMISSGIPNDEACMWGLLYFAL